MDSLRRRKPFKTTDDPLDEDRVLDEQEQDEIIEKLRDESEKNNLKHFKFIQGCLSFTIIFQCLFLLFPPQVTPIHILLPNHKTPRPPLIPLASLLTVSQIFILFNLVYHLPKDLSFPRVLHYWILRISLKLPNDVGEALHRYLPLSTKFSGLLLCLTPVIAVIFTRDLPQILWWSMPLLVFGLQMLVLSWIRDAEREIEGLEKLKYEAKGA